MAQSEHIIKNYDMLLSHGETKTRKVALDIAEAAIQRAIPYHETLRLIQRTPESISIGERTIFLREIDHIYVVGVGKGAYPIAQALEEKLGDLIDEGIVLVKKGDTRRLKRIEIIESGHPLPDQAGIDGAKKILSILQKAGERDLIFAPITGGSSAMMNLPCGRITLEDLRKINDALLKSGASIGKMNAVRKHLCKMKGGHLVEYAKPAEIHTLTLDTAPPDMPWPDLSLADPTTFQDAIDMMKEYAIWDEAPASIREHLLEGLAHPEMETPKKLTNTRAYIHSVADPRSTCVAAANKAKELGYTPYVLSTALEGDACNLVYFSLALLTKLRKLDVLLPPPAPSFLREKPPSPFMGHAALVAPIKKRHWAIRLNSMRKARRCACQWTATVQMVRVTLPEAYRIIKRLKELVNWDLISGRCWGGMIRRQRCFN